MSTTTTTIDPTVNKNKFRVAKLAIAFGLTIVATILIGTATVIAFNIGVIPASFWLGIVAPYYVAVVIFVLWITHHMARKRLGFAIATIDVIVALVVLALFGLLSGGTLSGEFGLGVLDAAIIGAVFALILLYGWIILKLKSKFNI